MRSEIGDGQAEQAAHTRKKNALRKKLGLEPFTREEYNEWRKQKEASPSFKGDVSEEENPSNDNTTRNQIREALGLPLLEDQSDTTE